MHQSMALSALSQGITHVARTHSVVTEVHWCDEGSGATLDRGELWKLAGRSNIQATSYLTHRT